MKKSILSIFFMALLLVACAEKDPQDTTKPKKEESTEVSKYESKEEESAPEDTANHSEVETLPVEPLSDDVRFVRMIEACQNYYTDASSSASQTIAQTNDPAQIQVTVDKAKLAWSCIEGHMNQGELTNVVKFPESKLKFAAVAMLMKEYEIGMEDYIANGNQESFTNATQSIMAYNLAWMDFVSVFMDENAANNQ